MCFAVNKHFCCLSPVVYWYGPAALRRVHSNSPIRMIPSKSIEPSFGRDYVGEYSRQKCVLLRRARRGSSKPKKECCGKYCRIDSIYYILVVFTSRTPNGSVDWPFDEIMWKECYRMLSSVQYTRLYSDLAMNGEGFTIMVRI